MNDKFEIIEIVNRYFADLDRRDFDEAEFEKIFAKEGSIVRPNGVETVGPKNIASSHRESFARFGATQHLTSGFIIDIDDPLNGTFRVNLVAMHIWADNLGDSTVAKQDNYFLAGGVVSGRAIKDSSGWHIMTISNDVAWKKGVGFKEVLSTK